MMNTQTIFKTHRNKYELNDRLIPDKRVKTSSSPNRMPLIGFKKNVSNIPNVVTNYNIQNLNLMDKDKLNEELIKCKNELNKKNKECHTLKIAFSKLDLENKRSVKIIEEVLEEASKKYGDENNNYESEIKNILSNQSLIWPSHKCENYFNIHIFPNILLNNYTYV